MEEAMHLVFVTSIVNHEEPMSGFEIANRVIVDALRRAGHRVTVLGFAWPGRRPADPDHTVTLGAVDVRTENASLPLKLLWLGKAMAAGLTFASVKLRAVPAERIREALAALEPFDGYVINGPQLAAAFPDLFHDRQALYVAHNVEHRSAAENAAAASGWLARLLYRREARLLRDIEARLCGRAAFVYVLAEEDRAPLGVDGPGRSVVLPLVTRITPPPPPAPRRASCDAALIGTWTWQPNRIGLDWFLASVVPGLPADFRVEIAGQLPSGVRSDSPQVSFVGRVPDAGAFMRRAAVVPLSSRAGTGVQLKTLETFELGLPAVATTRSLRGIDSLPGNCVVADEPREFAAAMVRQTRMPPSDADGRSFYFKQRAALDRALGVGLSRLAAGQRAAA